MTRMLLILQLMIVLLSSLLAAAEAQTKPLPPMTYESILKGLEEKSGQDLGEFIYAVHYNFNHNSLTDAQIDVLIDRLQAIRQNDPYQQEGLTKNTNGPRLYYYNRQHAENELFRLKFQKIVNGMRRLPMPERVAAIIDGMDKNWNLHYATDHLFGQELARCGKDAVPYIIQHKPKSTETRRKIVSALHVIRDPRGADYIIECLKVERKNFGEDLLHESAAKALAGFQGDKVLQALVDGLRDPAVQVIDRNEPQIYSPGHQFFNAKLYLVQLAAAQSLTTTTGHNWGLLFNEDAVTWKAWLDANDRSGFNPAQVKRTPADLKNLVSAMFDRFMSGRPNPWQPQNELERPEGIASLARDLSALGKDVVPLISSEARVRITADPIWADFLNYWTEQVMLSLPWPEAHQSAEHFHQPPLKSLRLPCMTEVGWR